MRSLINKIQKKLKDGSLKEMYKEAKWMYYYAKKYKYSIVYYIFLGLLGTIMSFAGSIGSKYLIDAVTTREVNNIFTIILIIISMGLGTMIINAITTRISAKINIKVNNEIQLDMYEKILTTDWESMKNFHSGDLLNRLNGDVATVSSSILGWIPNLITRSFQFLGALLIILYYDRTMAIIALLSAPITLIVSNWLMNKMRFFNREMRNISSKVMEFNEESFQNIQSIKTFDLIELFTNKLKLVQEEHKNISLDYNKFSIITSSFMQITGLIVTYICFGWGAYRLWNGYITFGTMTLFLQLANSLSGTFKSLISLVPSAISATTSAGRLMAFFELPKELIKDELVLDYIDSNTKENGICVEVSNVKFKYKDGDTVLEGTNISVKPSEVIALVGPSGGGKTTMMRILLGLINATDGKCYIKDCEGNICNISASTRKLMAYVPQEKTMFSGTIAENMRMVKPKATDQEIKEALMAACAYEFVQKLPDGINSKIGERGSGFSEGQNQRLSIARALLRNSPILLLDEATSALDVATERKVLRNIMALNKSRTCIVTTHRPSVLTMCDRVYKISQTNVTEATENEIEKMAVDF